MIDYEKLERYALENRVPILRPESVRLLLRQIAEHRPAVVLEVGTAIGYSALRMAEAMSAYGDPQIITLEKNPEMAALARRHIDESSYSGRIEVVEGDAAEILRREEFWETRVPEGRGLVFIDAAKAQYLRYFEAVDPRIRPGWVIVCDNMSFNGKNRDARRYRTICKRLAEFRKVLESHGAYRTAFYDTGDGMSVSVKLGGDALRTAKRPEEGNMEQQIIDKDDSAVRSVELLAPAGDLERLRCAIDYGADAVYIGGEVFGLRAAARNFTIDEIAEGLRYAHERGKRVYLTLNMIPHNADLTHLPAYLNRLAALDLDAVIVSDPGTLLLVRQHLPEIEIHLSTQANNTNSVSAKFWHQNGVKRIVLARELSFDEIREIRRDTPPTLEFEAFVHGAMCISYSGRCLLSSYMTGRDANRGDCAQPCRWSYQLVEKNRPGEYFQIEESESGTFVLNSKDLCMIERIPELIRSGLHSLKIEGRMKTAYYVASVVRVYREAIDRFMADPDGYRMDPGFLHELMKISHREYTVGFYDGRPGAEAQVYKDAGYVREYEFVGVVLGYDEASRTAFVEQRNNFKVGQELEVIGPKYFESRFVLESMRGEDNQPIDVAPHARMRVRIPVPERVEPGFFIRRRALPEGL